MTEQSRRLSLPYPSQDDDPWWDLFVDFVNSLDEVGFAAREDRHLILGEGGPLTWDPSTGTLTWGSAIVISSSMTGFRWEIQANSIVIEEGETLYVNLSRNPLQIIQLGALKASVVPNTNNALGLAIRIGDNLYWRNGMRMTGGSIPSLSPVQVTAASFTMVASAVGARTTADPVELIIGGGLFDGGMTIPSQIAFNLVGNFDATGTVGNVRVRLYDVGTESTPAAPNLRSTLTIPFADAGGTRSYSNVLSVVSSLTAVNQILNAPRVYEVTVELDGSDGLTDTANIYRGSLEVT